MKNHNLLFFRMRKKFPNSKKIIFKIMQANIFYHRLIISKVLALYKVNNYCLAFVFDFVIFFSNFCYSLFISKKLLKENFLCE